MGVIYSFFIRPKRSRSGPPDQLSPIRFAEIVPVQLPLNVTLPPLRLMSFGLIFFALVEIEFVPALMSEKVHFAPLTLPFLFLIFDLSMTVAAFLSVTS